MNFRSTTQQWGWIAICFHWITAIMVACMFVFGLWMVELSYYDEWYNTAPFIHKSTGIVLLLISVARITWRSIDVKPGAPHTYSNIEIKATHFIHAVLYIILFGVMLSGYLISTADGRAVNVFNLFEVPALVYDIDEQEDIAGDIHLALAVILVCIASLHAIAAIKHHYLDKDRTLKRMLGQ